MDATLLLAMIAVCLAVPPFLQWVQSARRWQRRRDPLRVEVSPHAHRDAAVFVTVTNVGDEDLALAWCSVTALAPDKTVGDHNGPDIHKMPLPPGSKSDGAIFMLERATMPVDGVRWTKIDVFDIADHHAATPIPADLSKHLE